MADEQHEETEAERAERKQFLARRSAIASAAALDGNNPAVRAEYHRRLQRGETIIMAWRRALWVVLGKQ